MTPAPSRLTKVGHARRHKRIVRLKLTQAGRAAISSCEARQIQVRAGKQRRGIDLVATAPAAPQADRPEPRARTATSSAPSRARAASFPFPDDYYTVRDPNTATGRRVNLKTASMPANVHGVHIDAAPYNASDGFSPGQAIVVKVPGLDSAAALKQTGAVPINHIGRFRDPEQPIVLIDADTGKRWRIWAEIDSNATSPASTALLINPAQNLASGHRYIVALRNLKTAGGQTIPAPAGFRYYRDRLPSNSPVINAAARALRGDLPRPCTRRASSATTSTWPGTSRSPATTTSPSGRSTCETTPSRRSATTPRPTGRWRGPRRSSRSPRWRTSPRPRIRR